MNNFSFYKDGKDLYCLIFMGMLLSFSSVYAKKTFSHNLPISQQHQIQGTITDGTNPLPGVTIAIKNKQNNIVISDYSGQYSLFASPDDTLVVSFIGFKTSLIAIQGRKKLDIQLFYDTTTLQEVRVNAGYYSVKEKERTGSIAKITSKDIEKQPVGNILAAMQGRMAGVEIIQDSGTPGGAFQIKIRGQNSLRADANQPLYIIDGVPYSSETIGSTLTSGGLPTMTSPLNSINPSDIESIEILKDGDATSIYGSRGANGVVLITTKKGVSGKTKFSVNASTSMGQVTKMLDLMHTNQYLDMRREAFANDGITTYPRNAYDLNGTWDQNRYTDWQKEFIGGTAQITSLQTSVTGGSAKTQYLLSGSTRNETTVFPGAFKYNRGSIHFSFNHVSEDDKFRLNFSAGYSAQKNFQPGTDLTRISRLLAPNAPALYDSNGNLNWQNNSWENPLAAYEAKFNAKINDLTANAVLSYNILQNLQIKSSFGYTDLRNNENMIQPSTMYNPSLGLGSESSGISTNLTLRSSWIVEPQINWSFNLGQGRMETLFGGTFQSQTSNRLFQSGYGFSSNSLIGDIASATLKVIDYSDESIYKYQAFFTRFNYNYDDRYILNITGRRDGSSRFGPGKQFANFGAVGFAWLFSKEKFLEENSLLSFGKLRTSYGITGNDQIGDYQFLDTYVSSGNTYQGTVGMQPSRLFNGDFGWETNKKFETALELGFFKDRLFFTAAYYQNRSSNQLVGMPLPGTTGFSSMTANLDAVVQNKGFEFTLRTVNFQNKNFEWNTSFNISANRSKLLSYPGLETSAYSNRYVVGKSINITKVYHSTGINPQTGVYTYEDVNSDGLISAVADRQTIIDLNPEYYGGLQNQITFKKIQLDFLLQFVKQDSFSYTPGLPGTAINQLSSLTNFWQQAGDIADYQKLTSGRNGALSAAYSRYRTSDGAIEDASYIRLKNISLSYDLPLDLTKGIQCRIYMQGQNLLTFTKYKGGDPEFKFAGYLPPLKVYTAGIQLTF
ncbi:SusC/RagA family TonB-linked outer membrane protein [Flavobacterium sp. 1355]|uniref:SusC/RagA family TonB-linked outer membrane protein n=1 Tax=Flavobacterium sp. 1355 TaxID=2806571 RepID=UPI001AE4C9F9|nr:SusC/RagA family TonB-linked outer membrane protein [Flavobacterium sp. 1355]MBP1222345.1 TonB-linked SusC/RagA family outer membrane protein [Flavobacterium sp. 1355]